MSAASYAGIPRALVTTSAFNTGLLWAALLQGSSAQGSVRGLPG